MPTAQEEFNGRDVAAERVRSGLSQKELADALGIPRPLLSQIENNTPPLSQAEYRRYIDIAKGLAPQVSARNDNSGR